MNKILLIVIFLTPYFVCGQLLLNEISSVRGYEDSKGNDCDWLEIVNIGNSPINLSKYFLSDNLSNLDKWNFPEEYLDSMQHMLVLCSGTNKSYRVRNWQSIINRSSKWYYILGNSEPDINWKSTLYNNTSWIMGYMGSGFDKNVDSTLVSGLSSLYLRTNFKVPNLSSIQKLILHAEYDDAFIAYLNGVEIARSINIHGETNNKSLKISDNDALIYRSLSHEKYIIDNAIIDSVLIIGDNVLAIEVHAVDSISDDMRAIFHLHAGINSDLTYFNVPTTWFDDTVTFYHTNFKISNSETIFISDSAGNILDQKLITTPRSLISEGRYPSGIGSWCYFENPSPGISNNVNLCYNGITKEPNISLNSGWYTKSEYLIMDVPHNSHVYYTLNGDIPDDNDYKYTDTLWFDSTTVLSARAFSQNLLPSKVIDRTFIFNEENFGIPVFSIFTDSLNLWDQNTGIYVYGPNPSSKYPYRGSNFWKKSSVWSRLEFFDKKQNKQVEAEFDLEISGGWSRAEPQKSFTLDFKSRYSSNFNWPLFSDKPHISNFNNINLRNGGNVARRSKIEDALACKLAIGTNVDVIGYEPCILYLNGKYWGIYGVREKKDKRYLQDNHSVNKDSIDLIFGNNSLFNNSLFNNFSSSMEFINCYYEIMNFDPNSNHFFILIDSIFDIRNYIDYFILQIYFGNSDWMDFGANNVKLWRPTSSNGKWRYILYDVDGGFKGVMQNTFNQTLNPQRYNMHSDLFKKFIQNNEFKYRFDKRFSDLLTTNLSHENITEKVNSLKDQIENAMPNQIERWMPPIIPLTYRDTIAITSMSDWHQTIDDILDFSSKRKSYILKYLE